ncbi:helix-turn-helix domain-containing protein [Pseudomonas sp. R1-18]|uniref:response regulator transcription factor n=1 Tax=Pseudomonas sp. R1-18 TaxID=1632772 RepID=UPI003DA9710A
MNSVERFSDGVTDNAGETTAVGVQLTAKEHEVLGWAALGKSSWEISRILGRTEAAVNFHLGNIRRKFGVHSMKAALVKAIQQRLILLE